MTIGLAQDSLQKNLVLTERIDESSQSSSLMLERVVPLIERSAENVTRISMVTDSLLPLVNDIQRMSTTTAVHSEQIIQSMESFAKSNMIIADVINRLALSQPTSESSGRHENLCNNFRSNLRTMHLRDINTELQSASRKFVPCSCRSFSQAQTWEPLSILHFRRIFRSQHFSHCPRYQVSEQSLEFVARLVPPKWLLSYTISLGIQFNNLYTHRAVSICPAIFGVKRLVDGQTSPAFIAIDLAGIRLTELSEDIGPGFGVFPGTYTDRKKAEEEKAEEERACISSLQSKLQILFNNGLASPLDETSFGNTLLFVSNIKVN